MEPIDGIGGAAHGGGAGDDPRGSVGERCRGGFEHDERIFVHYGRRPHGDSDRRSYGDVRDGSVAAADGVAEHPTRVEDLDTDEVAQLLEISPGAVKTRLHRARQALRGLLEPHLREGTPR